VAYVFECRSRFRVLIRAAGAKSQASNYCSCSFRRFEPRPCACILTRLHLGHFHWDRLQPRTQKQATAKNKTSRGLHFLSFGFTPIRKFRSSKYTPTVRL
jgi:hypothetical protein